MGPLGAIAVPRRMLPRTESARTARGAGALGRRPKGCMRRLF